MVQTELILILGGCENTNIYEDPNASWWESGLYVIVDKNGNGCDEGYFSFATDLCGKFDTVDFKAKAMCCVCGGGETGKPLLIT